MTRIKDLLDRWFGHPHRCGACGRPSWCKEQDRGRAITCPGC
jgi:hypothetical protein